jgi:hypothetical protein
MAQVLLPYGTSFAAVQTFVALWRKFCLLIARVLLPYGPVLINRAQYKILDPRIFFWGCGVKVSPRTACCCQKHLISLCWLY